MTSSSYMYPSSSFSGLLSSFKKQPVHSANATCLPPVHACLPTAWRFAVKKKNDHSNSGCGMAIDVRQRKCLSLHWFSSFLLLNSFFLSTWDGRKSGRGCWKDIEVEVSNGCAAKISNVAHLELVNSKVKSI